MCMAISQKIAVAAKTRAHEDVPVAAEATVPNAVETAALESRADETGLSQTWTPLWRDKPSPRKLSCWPSATPQRERERERGARETLLGGQDRERIATGNARHRGTQLAAATSRATALLRMLCAISKMRSTRISPWTRVGRTLQACHQQPPRDLNPQISEASPAQGEALRVDMMLVEHPGGKKPNHRETKDKAKIAKQAQLETGLGESWNQVSEELGDKFAQSVNDRIAPNVERSWPPTAELKCDASPSSQRKRWTNHKPARHTTIPTDAAMERLKILALQTKRDHAQCAAWNANQRHGKADVPCASLCQLQPARAQTARTERPSEESACAASAWT